MPLLQMLLVEDNASDAFLISSMLGDMGNAAYRIRHVRTQAEALEVLGEHMFDVCLLDLRLPDANGFSALIEIQEKAVDMPVLILTGLNDTALARQAVGRGAQDYLLKDEMKQESMQRSIDYAIERKRTEKALFERANYDSLTQLANRNLFSNRLGIALARAERTGAGVAVLYIDLDRFKPINDVYGHDAGDEVLKVVAKRLQKALRAYDTPARFGGDEFAVLLESVPGSRDAAVIAQKIIQTLIAPVPYQGQKLEVGVSIGIAFYDMFLDQEELLQHADLAMYHAKKKGGNAYSFFAQEMHDTAEMRLKMEDDLRGAFARREFRLYYQPYIMARGSAMMGVEVLARWEHPERGLLCPDAFLKPMELGRMMPEFSAWMAGQLRHDLARLHAYDTAPLQIAVNLSESQLEDVALLAWFEGVMAEKLPGHHQLVVEIAEDVLMAGNEMNLATLAKLSDIGILLHLDHFCRGSVCLQTLLSLPFSMLKIDLSLVQGMVDRMESDVLVKAAVMLAHHIGLKVGGVGVEIPWQMKVLDGHQCDVVQGYLIAPPMALENMMVWLRSRQEA